MMSLSYVIDVYTVSIIYGYVTTLSQYGANTAKLSLNEKAGEILRYNAPRYMKIELVLFLGFLSSVIESAPATSEHVYFFKRRELSFHSTGKPLRSRSSYAGVVHAHSGRRALV